MDINGLRDAVRPSLARFLSIGARRQRPGLLFHTSRVLLTTPKRKREKNDGRAVRMASSRSMSFANASRNKIFETRARILWLSRIFVVLFLFAISLLLPAFSPLVLSNLYISSALPFFFPCSITLCVRESIDRRKILSFAADRRCITFGSKFTQQD